MKQVYIALVASVTLLGACDTTQEYGQKETFGAITGAVLGGVLGSQVGKGDGQMWATGAGAVLGAIAGSAVGRSLDQQDRAMMQRTSQSSLEYAATGSTSTWKNPDSGHSGSVTPTKTYKRSDGTYCREFEQYITIDGQENKATGTACRQPDGSWRVIS